MRSIINNLDGVLLILKNNLSTHKDGDGTLIMKLTGIGVFFLFYTFFGWRSPKTKLLPDKLKDLRLISLPLLHSLFHCRDDGIGLILGSVLR